MAYLIKRYAFFVRENIDKSKNKKYNEKHKKEGKITGKRKLRQTDLSFEELITEFKNSESTYPEYFIINEIGGVCFNGDRESRKRAEEFLRNLLEDKDNEDERDIVFCWLSIIENPDSQTIALIKKFKNDPANQGVIEEARDRIDRFNLE